jgi:HEAT repeat protein
MKLLQTAAVTLLVLLAAASLDAAGVGAVPAAPAAVPELKELDSLIAGVASDDIQTRANAQKAIEVMAFNASRPGAEAERVACAKAMAAKLGAATPAPARVWLLRQLQWIGRAEVVPTVAGLLADKDAQVAECARRALAHNSSQEAAAALRAALDKAATPEWRVAYLNALGARRDAAAAPAACKALADKDESVAAAAAAALGRIGGPDAANALGAARAAASAKLKLGITDAYLQCADQMAAQGQKDAAAAIYQQLYVPAEPKAVQMAALRGLVVVKGEQAVPMLAEALAGKDEQSQAIALSFVQEIPGPAAMAAMIALMPKLQPAGQAALIGQLGRRGDPAGKATIVQATQNKDDAVRTAAFGALAGVGGAAEVPLLAKTAAAAAGPEADAARSSLGLLRGQDVNAAMLAAMAGADAKVRVELIKALGARKATEAVPALAKAAQDTDAAVRVEAIKSLDVLADEKVLPLMINILTKAAADEERQAAEKTVLSICGRATNKDACAQTVLGATTGAAMPAKGSLLKALARLGGVKALAAVKAAVADPDATVKEGGVRALAEWVDAAAAPDLLNLAKTETKTTLQVLALRGYVRLITVPPDRPNADKFKMCQEALAAAKRPDEKKLVLGPLGDIPGLEALRVVLPMLDEQPLRGEAANAAVKIAKATPGAMPPEVKDAMEKILAFTKDKRLTKDAEDVMKRVKPAAAPKPAAKKK